VCGRGCRGHHCVGMDAVESVLIKSRGRRDSDNDEGSRACQVVLESSHMMTAWVPRGDLVPLVINEV
jgi:hypothetical protein